MKASTVRKTIADIRAQVQTILDSLSALEATLPAPPKPGTVTVERTMPRVSIQPMARPAPVHVAKPAPHMIPPDSVHTVTGWRISSFPDGRYEATDGKTVLTATPAIQPPGWYMVRNGSPLNVGSLSRIIHNGAERYVAADSKGERLCKPKMVLREALAAFAVQYKGVP